MSTFKTLSTNKHNVYFTRHQTNTTFIVFLQQSLITKIYITIIKPVVNFVSQSKCVFLVQNSCHLVLQRTKCHLMFLCNICIPRYKIVYQGKMCILNTPKNNISLPDLILIVFLISVVLSIFELLTISEM